MNYNELNEQEVTLTQVKDLIVNYNNKIYKEFLLLKIKYEKPKRIILTITSVLCFLYAAIMLLGGIALFASSNDDGFTAENTVELSGHIEKINPIPYTLKLIEYNATFSIYDSSLITDMDVLANLSNGDSISFRIKEDSYNNLNVVSRNLYIITLSIDNNEIISLDSYNNNNGEEGGAIALTIVGTLLLTGSIVSLVFYKKKKRFAREQLNELVGDYNFSLEEIEKIKKSI